MSATLSQHGADTGDGERRGSTVIDQNMIA